ELTIAVINAGGWGTALAVVLARAGYSVSLWARRAEVADRLTAERENEAYLPGVRIPAEVEVTGDLAMAVGGRSVVVVAVISRYMRSIARQLAPHVERDALVVHGSKGFEPTT